MDSSVFFIFAVVVVGTSLAFLFEFFFASFFPLSDTCGGGCSGNLSAHSPSCRCYLRLLHRSLDRILC